MASLSPFKAKGTEEVDISHGRQRQRLICLLSLTHDIAGTTTRNYPLNPISFFRFSIKAQPSLLPLLRLITDIFGVLTRLLITKDLLAFPAALSGKSQYSSPFGRPSFAAFLYLSRVAFGEMRPSCTACCSGSSSLDNAVTDCNDQGNQSGPGSCT